MATDVNEPEWYNGDNVDATKTAGEKLNRYSLVQALMWGSGQARKRRWAYRRRDSVDSRCTTARPRDRNKRTSADKKHMTGTKFRPRLNKQTASTGLASTFHALYDCG